MEWVQRTGQAPGNQMFAIEYYCPTCRERGYKGVEEADRRLYRQACQEFERERTSLPLPEGEVLPGVKTAELLNHGLRRWTAPFSWTFRD